MSPSITVTRLADSSPGVGVFSGSRVGVEEGGSTSAVVLVGDASVAGGAVVATLGLAGAVVCVGRSVSAVRVGVVALEATVGVCGSRAAEVGCGKAGIGPGWVVRLAATTTMPSPTPSHSRTRRLPGVRVAPRLGFGFDIPPNGSYSWQKGHHGCPGNSLPKRCPWNNSRAIVCQVCVRRLVQPRSHSKT